LAGEPEQFLSLYDAIIPLQKYIVPQCVATILSINFSKHNHAKIVGNYKKCFGDLQMKKFPISQRYSFWVILLRLQMIGIKRNYVNMINLNKVNQSHKRFIKLK